MFVNGKGSIEQSFESGGEKTHYGNKSKLWHETFFKEEGTFLWEQITWRSLYLVIKDPPKPEPWCSSKKRALESTSNSGRDGVILSFGTKRQPCCGTKNTQCCLQGALLFSHFGYPSWHPTRPWPRTSFPRVRFASWKLKSKKPMSLLLLTNHHSSFPNLLLISKTTMSSWCHMW